MFYYNYKICNLCSARVTCNSIIIDENEKETCPFCRGHDFGPVMMNYEKYLFDEMMKIMFAE